MQQVHIEAVGFQTAQACLACGDRAAPGGVLRQHFADEEDVAAAIGERLGDELFCRAVSVHFGRIDNHHPEVDGHLQRGNLICACLSIFAHVPGANPQRRDGFSVRERNRSDVSHIPL